MYVCDNQPTHPLQLVKRVNINCVCHAQARRVASKKSRNIYLGPVSDKKSYKNGSFSAPKIFFYAGKFGCTINHNQHIFLQEVRW